MPTPTKGPRLGEARARTADAGEPRHSTVRARRYHHHPGQGEADAATAERLITFAKRGDLHARRRVLTVVHNKDVVHELFTEIGPRYANRNGGYTRITKLGPRRGDNAPMARIELVEPLSEQAVAEAEAAAKRCSQGTRRPREAAAAAAAAKGAQEAEAEETAVAATEATEDAPGLTEHREPGVHSPKPMRPRSLVLTKPRRLTISSPRWLKKFLTTAR